MTSSSSPSSSPAVDLDGATSPDMLSRPLYGASFGQAIKRFFRNYAKFTGRASRSEFSWAFLFLVLILFPLYLWLLITTGQLQRARNVQVYGGSTDLAPLVMQSTIALILFAAIGLALLVPWLAINWRRLHDANLAGPYFFFYFVPILTNAMPFVLMLWASRPEGRRFDRD